MYFLTPVSDRTKTTPEPLKNEVNRALANYSWSVFTKSSMVDTPSDYCGRPFGGVAVICRHHKDSCPSQFGFRNNRGTTFAAASYFRHWGSPVYTCSLYAEKCFDSIWHIALLYKLRDKIPTNQWLIMCRWYSRLKASVRMNGSYSNMFNITRGTRQSSVLSPRFFCIFLNSLLVDLDAGVRIGPDSYQSFAYADDINLFSATVGGLQSLIDICLAYSKKWQFNFGIAKSKCMISGADLLCRQPSWYLGSQRMDNSTEINVLGIIFTDGGKSEKHVNKRIQKCRQGFYSMSSSGMSYPGLPTDIKSHLWKTVCCPTLLYGMEAVSLSKIAFTNIESTQGSLIKQSLGLSKGSHHSQIMTALNVSRYVETINYCIINLWRRIFKVGNLCCYFAARYIVHGDVFPQTLAANVINMECI